MSNTLPIDSLPLCRTDGEGNSVPDGLSYSHIPSDEPGHAGMTSFNIRFGEAAYKITVHHGGGISGDVMIQGKDGSGRWECLVSRHGELPQP